jgi:hypothetical protein
MIYFIYPIALATTIQSDFSCNNIDATTTFYSYLKEPSLQASGYTRGLKEGTFNYFENGKVDLSHSMTYYDGKIDADHPPGSDTNSTLQSKLNVDFRGESGISEYYAKGFFPNNRAISAFKKIWSIDYSNSDWMLGGIYKSQRINVEASAKMGPNMSGGDYRFLYHARVENGYLEVKDAAGWSNKTGARRIDWEQEAAMRGKLLDVTNNLEVNSLYRPSAGLYEDWLPCACNGTIPPIEGLDTAWPSPGVYATLLPNMLRPGSCTPYVCTGCQNGLSAKSNIGLSAGSNISPSARSNIGPSTGCQSCNPIGCPSFPAIYTYPDYYGESVSGGLTQEEQNLLKTGERVTAFGDFGLPDIITNNTRYAMSVKNTGDVRLDDVHFDVTIPQGFYITYMDKSQTQILSDGVYYWRIGPLAPLESWDLNLDITPPANSTTKWDTPTDKKTTLSLVQFKAFGTYNGKEFYTPSTNATPNDDWGKPRYSY